MTDLGGIQLNSYQKCSDSLGPAWNNFLENVKQVDHINVDETGHKENGDLMWTWCFRTELYCLFLIDESRGSKVLMETLGRRA
jgi:transposase